MSQETVLWMLREVSRRTSQSRATLYGRMDPNSSQYDPSFPRPIRVGPKAIRWVSHEVEAWINSRERA